MTSEFDQLIDRHGTNCFKWDKYKNRDVIPMWVADTDFAVLPEIQAALAERIQHPVFGYSYPSPRLVELVVERMQRLYGWQIEPQWLVWITGVVPGMYLSCRSIGAAGDRVFTPSLIYPYFQSMPSRASRQRIKVPMTQSDRRPVIDLEWMSGNLNTDELLLFCNPQNPGGSCYREEELQQLADIVVERQAYICSDEIHCDLILDEDKRHMPIASLNEEIARRSITLMAPSKNFNIAGLKCAFAVIPDKTLRDRFGQVADGVADAVNLLGLVAAEAAYEHGDEWNRQQCRYLAANRDYLARHLNAISGLSLGPTEATYLAWIKVAELGLEDPPAFFVQQARVGLSAGAEFGDVDYMRLNFGCPRSRLQLAVDRIREALT